MRCAASSLRRQSATSHRAVGVEIGSTLRSGDPLGYVDVLGVRQEVVSPIDGALRAFEVESGQAVEYGQLIARVEAEA